MFYAIVIIAALVIALAYQRGRRDQAEALIRELEDEIFDLRSKPEITGIDSHSQSAHEAN